MFESPKYEKISPQYVNEASMLAEQRMHKLIEAARDLGVEIFSLEDGEEKILEQVKQGFPQRYELVVQKLRDEGLKLSDLPKDVLLDRMLGIDMMFTFQGKNYAVDVTSGKHTVVKNKERKFQAMESLYKQLGIDRALIIRLKEDVTDDMVLDLFARLEVLDDKGDIFSVIVRYPETKIKK
ncbi:hypothetical protein HYV44_02180 [Candidatus Microgenomates bacterium]|nr:hypothetical protein [Candidatus Microgenomates bacterium]